ncbi:MAG TPA: hypothetical protein VJ733_01040 [Candidatus Binatia bacterium]|nr:hypothetical protein [Candidatus Binatia bacterium]
MKSFVDLFRAILISPEVIALVLPFAVGLYWPEPAVFFAEQFSADIKWAFGAAAIPVAFIAASYQIGGEIISPQGTRRVLLDWPDYSMLKNRIVLALIFCALGLVLVIAGAFTIGSYKSSFGATMIFSGLLVSATSLATVGLAKWKIRELLRE